MSIGKHTYAKNELPSPEQLAIGCQSILVDCLWAVDTLASSEKEYELDDNPFDSADIHIDDLKRILSIHVDLAKLMAVFLAALNDDGAGQ